MDKPSDIQLFSNYWNNRNSCPKLNLLNDLLVEAVSHGQKEVFASTNIHHRKGEDEVLAYEVAHIKFCGDVYPGMMPLQVKTRYFLASHHALLILIIVFHSDIMFIVRAKHSFQKSVEILDALL